MTSHVVTVPIDVVKTRIQIRPDYYCGGILNTAKKIIVEEGAKSLTLGIGPTFMGYFCQGALKFGLYDQFRSIIVDKAIETFPNTNNLLVFYMISAAFAEMIASSFLTPFEAIRIRMVNQQYKQCNNNNKQKTTTKTTTTTIHYVRQIIQLEGFNSLFKGLIPILAKQVPYTCVQLASFSSLLDLVYGHYLDRSTLSLSQQLCVTTSLGISAGFLSAIVSHPADTLLTKVCMNPNISLLSAAKLLGWKRMWLGLIPRCLHISLISAFMFLVNDSVKISLGLNPSTGSK
eukprot:TRINITY_DN560_c1_g3_i1.p1 TRINITY_DN560_c1_g3~~TRINITY_DN560_c1_g3_i1.p1  ORF type:complete len:288 (+),score=113.74 TRINITY_DN560_c1_g3_i1:142-1005(+)